jgi:hypothetical protein
MDFNQILKEATENLIDKGFIEVGDAIGQIVIDIRSYIVSDFLQESNTGLLKIKKVQNSCIHAYRVLKRFKEFVDIEKFPPNLIQANEIIDDVNDDSSFVITTLRKVWAKPDVYDQEDRENLHKIFQEYTEVLAKLTHTIHQINLKFPANKISARVDNSISLLKLKV